MYTLDQTWLPFSDLMLKHIYNVLLICSDYDRFMLEEDGRVEEELYKEYMDLGLSTPPKITHTDNEEEALNLIKILSFDLVITMIEFQSGKVEKLAKTIKAIKPDMPVIVLAPAPDHRKLKALKDEQEYIDQIFYWQGNAKLFLAMVKLIEDALNLEHDTSVADVQVIILIEDSVRFISSYLPNMYTSLIHQNRLSILEALNDWGKTLRMRGRPKIVLARDGEKGMEYYQKYKKNILGIITDVNFPYRGATEGSGIKLTQEIRSENPELPILLQSTEKKHEAEARALGADFLWKNSPDLLSGLSKHFINYYNFGPFSFINPANGEVIETVTTMKELQHALKTIPIESFIYHSKRNDFSKWFRAQSLYALAGLIKNINLGSQEPETVRSWLYDTIKQYRTQRTRGVIAEFSPNSYDDTSFFSRIGGGSLGGKGRGLAFIAAEMQANEVQKEFPDIYLSIPKTVVVSTSLYDEFMEMNKLNAKTLSEMNDKDILRLFLSKDVPEELRRSLEVFLKFVSYPLSVRSSSLLEDSHSEPFAGVYQTCMISNAGDEDTRLKELEAAIKTIWASVFFARAREYLRITGHMAEEEKMAVVIQQVTGSRHGDYYFPNVSGVARSINYYPVDNQKSEDGVGMLSFGFGKSVVDDGSAFRFCPAKPKKPSGSLTGDSGQQEGFYALNVTKPFNPLDNIDNLEYLPISLAAEKYPKSLKYIASTLDTTTGLLSEASFAEGIKMITFNGMLKYDMFPLAPVVDRILKLGQESMKTPVEIEIAINTERSKEKKSDFSILQIRPIASAYTESDVDIEEYEIPEALVYSNSVMGNGSIDSIKDIITIKPEAFKAAEMVEMASELAILNADMEDKEYVLIAAGRLGSTDRWLGIPCSWSDISRARVIVETGLPELQVEPSQGTHFFQNMTSLGCIYLTVNPMYNEGIINYEKIKELGIIKETKHFIQVHSEKDLDIRANGLEKAAIIKMKKEKEVWD